MARFPLTLAALAIVAAAGAGPALAQDQPLIVNYGSRADIAQGDNDHRQAVYLAVPADTAGPLYFRIFDPDTGWKHDHLERPNRRLAGDVRTRFTLFGGAGAFVERPTDPVSLTEAELQAGTEIASRVFGAHVGLDTRWLTFAEITAAQGDLVGNERIFRLVADALTGADGNVFDVTISRDPEDNVAPEGLRIFSLAPTVRMPSRGVETEVRFRIPEDAETLVIGNFDAAIGEVHLTTRFQVFPLSPSGQGDWGIDRWQVPAELRGEIAALTVAGGSEYPNDTTYYITTADGRPIQIDMPPQLLPLNQRPLPLGRIDNRLACMSVGFDGSPARDAEGDALSYRWDFGDGSSAEGMQVTHAYRTEGWFTPRLFVDTPVPHLASGAVRTWRVLAKQPPEAKSEVRKLIGEDEAVPFDGAPSTARAWTVVRHRWDFGDGSTAEGARVEHAYAEPGRYQVTHTVTDDSHHLCDTASETFEIVVNARPTAAAGADRRIAIGEETVLDGGASTDSDGTVARYDWDFGDGSTAAGQAVTHAYAAPGTYTVRLDIRDDADVVNSAHSDTLTVIVNDPPLPEAGADRAIAIGEVSTLDATASRDPDGTLIAYDWDFGDGSTASGATVDHAWAASGTYTVTLTVTDDSTTRTRKVSDTLTVFVNQPPVAVAGDDRSVAIAEPIAFDAGASTDSDGKLIRYSWDFGDGATADGAAVTHDYAKSGVYDVRLTVQDDSTTGTDTVSDMLSVRVNEPPVARAGPDQLVTASLVRFDGAASSDLDDSVARYDWDFGDGKTGEGSTPAHVYERPGTYDVRLTVTDASGTIRSSAEDTLTVVVNARPIADAGPDLVGAPGERLVFQGGRSIDPDGKVAVFEWDFRDGATATGETATHAFAAPGTYLVRLRVVDDTGQDEAIDFATAEVFVNAVPVADAGADIATVPDAAVTLSAVASFDPDGNIASYRWDFSDSDQPVFGAVVDRAFAAPGIYTAQLTVTDDSGAANSVASDEIRIAVNHAPVAEAGANVATDRLTVSFDGGGSVDADGDPLAYRWDFGDGSRAVGPVVAHTYAAGGTYPVILTVDDGTGLANAVARDSLSVKIDRAPVAMAGDDQRVCTGETVVLDGSKSTDPEGGVLRYGWDFGDGTRSTVVNPTKTYFTPGVYPVTLQVRDDSGFATNVHADRLAVTVDQGPIAKAGADIAACALTEVQFDGSASTDVDGVVNSFRWDFGDGSFGGGERPSHIFDRPGDYRVTLTIDGEQVGLCSRIANDELVVKIIEGPVAVIAAADALPISEAAVFDGSGSRMTDGRITGWTWDFGDGSTGSGEKVEHRYAAPGTYTVTLRLTSDSPAPSCREVAGRHRITVNAPPAAEGGDDRPAAVGEEVVFDGGASSDSDGTVASYQWDFGDGATATGITARHRYDKPGSYIARLTVTDNAGLANSSATDSFVVAVNEPPVAAIAGPAVACVGETVAWRGDGSTDIDGPIAGFAWSFGDGAGAATANASHVYRRVGRYPLTLSVDDGKGLANSASRVTRDFHVNQPPRAAAGVDRLVCPGDSVAFDASASTDGDGKLIRYQWDFADGTAAEGRTVDHAFARPGTYEVRLTVTDDAASSCSTHTDAMTVVVNAPPVADAGADREAWVGGANDAVLLDGSASSDPDGQALTYNWRIGNGDSQFGERVRHGLAAAGKVPVTLTVSDPTGLACGTASHTVNILAKPR